MHRILAAFIVLSSSALAKLPELDAVFWGEVRHLNSTPLVPANPGSVRVLARLNGVTIAEALVAPGQSQFVLKIPRDDGQNPRLPGTARANERVRVFIRSLTHDAEEESLDLVAAGGLLVSPVKGDLVPANLSVSADFSEGPQGIEAWLLAYGLPLEAATIDSDSDGQRNDSEFAAGTDPTDSGDRFRILEVIRSGGNNFIKFGPIRPPRSYSIWCSESLGETGWSNIGQVTPGNAGDYFLFGHPTPASPKVFYKLQVEAP
jgi:hypothetical protein